MPKLPQKFYQTKLWGIDIPSELDPEYWHLPKEKGLDSSQDEGIIKGPKV